MSHLWSVSFQPKRNHQLSKAERKVPILLLRLGAYVNQTAQCLLGGNSPFQRIKCPTKCPKNVYW
jgi:hypothetical protein